MIKLRYKEASMNFLIMCVIVLGLLCVIGLLLYYQDRYYYLKTSPSPSKEAELKGVVEKIINEGNPKHRPHRFHQIPWNPNLHGRSEVEFVGKVHWGKGVANIVEYRSYYRCECGKEKVNTLTVHDYT